MVIVNHPSPIKTAVPLPMEAIEAWCRTWGVTEFALFGSILRNDFHELSDVDVLVTTEADRPVTWDDREVRMESLQRILGRRVDLVERRNLERSVNWYRRCEILSSARVVYAA